MDGKRIAVAIVVFPDVELLDFCGPYEALSACRLDESRRRDEPSPFAPRLVGATLDAVACANGPRFLPDVTRADCPVPDVLLVPGGWGVRAALDDAALVARYHGEAVAQATADHMEYAYSTGNKRRVSLSPL